MINSYLRRIRCANVSEKPASFVKIHNAQVTTKYTVKNACMMNTSTITTSLYLFLMASKHELRSGGTYVLESMNYT